MNNITYQLKRIVSLVLCLTALGCNHDDSDLSTTDTMPHAVIKTSKGNKVLINIYMDMKAHYSFSYNEKGWPTLIDKEMSIDYTNNTICATDKIGEFTLNEQGYMTRLDWKWIDPDNITQTTSFDYDDKGFITKITSAWSKTINEDGSLTTYVYSSFEQTFEWVNGLMVQTVTIHKYYYKGVYTSDKYTCQAKYGPANPIGQYSYSFSTLFSLPIDDFCLVGFWGRAPQNFISETKTTHVEDESQQGEVLKFSSTFNEDGTLEKEMVKWYDINNTDEPLYWAYSYQYRSFNSK